MSSRDGSNETSQRPITSVLATCMYSCEHTTDANGMKMLVQTLLFYYTRSERKILICFIHFLHYFDVHFPAWPPLVVLNFYIYIIYATCMQWRNRCNHWHRACECSSYWQVLQILKDMLESKLNDVTQLQLKRLDLDLPCENIDEISLRRITASMDITSSLYALRNIQELRALGQTRFSSELIYKVRIYHIV